MKFSIFCLAVAALFAAEAHCRGVPVALRPTKLSRGGKRSVATRFWHPSQAGSGGCTKCRDGAECCGGEVCCADSSCCPGDSQCCGDVCCQTAVQQCCPDAKNGGVCCESEGTFCCPPNPATGMASRCCPRDFVCCPGGRDGCCDPGLINDNGNDGASRAGEAAALALMTMANLKDNLPLIAFPLSLSGRRGAPNAVTEFQHYSESTRPWHYMRSTDTWVLVRANFTNGVNGTEIHLYTAASAGGAAGVYRVAAGPTGLVTGMAVHRMPGSNTERIVFATRYMDRDNNPAGYSFWVLDPTGSTTDPVIIPTLAAQRPFSGGVDDYCGYFRNAVTASDGSIVVYRVGYEDVVGESNPGVGFVYISSSGSALASFASVSAAGYQPFITAAPHGTSGSGTLLGLASAASALGGADLALFALPLTLTVSTAGTDFVATIGTPRALAKLGNAHTTPHFGPIGMSVSNDGSMFAALVVRGELDPTYDLWEVVSVPLTHGGNGTVTPSGPVSAKVLEPMALADTNGLSGFSLSN